VFPEGTQPKILRACRTLVDRRIAQPVVLGPRAKVEAVADKVGISLDGVELVDHQSEAEAERRERFEDELFRMRQRKGVTRQTAAKAMDRKRNYGMMMVRNGDVDGLVSGVGMHYPETIKPALQILGLEEGARVCAGMYMMLLDDRTLFFADTTVNIDPSAEELAEIAVLCANEVSQLGFEPRVAMLSFSNFGSNKDPRASKVRKATALVRTLKPDLVVDGEMQVDPAVDPALAEAEFPFSEIQGDANILVFPSLEAANVAYKLMMRVGGAEAIGPILLGMRYPVNVLQRGCSVDEVVNMAAYTGLQAQMQGRLI
jgi:malate dehydrogenase (oxaloacetate-decarboxylating)(NADP+)